MTTEKLEEKKKDLEGKFNALEDKKIESSRLLKEIEAEQLRLQGEFRLVDALIKEISVEAVPPETEQK